VGTRGASGSAECTQGREGEGMGWPLRGCSRRRPYTRPEHLKRSPQPLGYASTRLELRELREQYRAFVAAFRD
jgi:hypothetical protein